MDKQTAVLIDNYSTGLADVAVEQNRAIEIREQLEACLSIFSELNLNQILSNQSYSHDDKVKIINQLEVEDFAIWNNFLKVIIQNQRENLIEEIMHTTKVKLEQKTATFELAITTAVPLSIEQKERMIDMANHKMGITAGRVIEIIDPAIIGGFVLKANNKIIDTSLKTQLQEFKMNMK